MHLEIEAIGVRVVSTNVVEAWPQLESPLQRRFQTRELSTGNERAEVIHAGFDLAGRVDARESLFPVHFHQREQPECPHLPVCLGEMLFPLAVENVQRFEGGIGPDIFDPSRDLAQVEIAYAFRSLAVIAIESLEQI